MRNFERLATKNGKYFNHRLIDGDGNFVEVFDTYTESLINARLAAATVKRYSEAVAQFLDYLFDAGVFGQPCSRYELLKAVDRYLPARMAGPTATNDHINIVRSLGLKRLDSSSASSAAAAINRFLKLSDYRADLEEQIAEWHGETHADTPSPKDLFKRLTEAKRSHSEVRQIMQKSMIANVVRAKPEGIEKPRGSGVKSPQTRSQEDDKRDLPVEWVHPLLDASTSYRDRAVWALMAGAGLRHSEAAQLTWDAIDIEAQQVFVFDPDSDRYADQMPEEYRPRFKGRKYSETYILPQLRDVFFEALADYVRYEHRPKDPDHMVFQDITAGGNGRPYSEVSDKSKRAAFLRACKKAGIPAPPGKENYTPHSLRHFYGVFMLNYVPTEGGYGITLTEVQRLMGHKDRATTAKYAREDPIILETKLLLIDQIAMGQQPNERELKAWVVQRHQDIAHRLLNSDLKGIEN